MAKAVGSLEGPYTCPTTDGIVEKNPPLPIPFMMINNTKGASESDTGQIANMLSALVMVAMNIEVTGPILSPNWPKPILPKAEERLNMAKSVDPVLVDRCMEEAYNGMKKGGTSNGKVAIPDPKKRRRNLGSSNRALLKQRFSKVTCWL